MLTFGPIPSRRLGKSLGINNIPPKTCSYSCIYCQVGRTNKLITDRKEFYQPEDIFNEVSARINQLINAGEYLDYITFVPDGEPTLDNFLGESIERLKSFGVKVAVISNSSLLWRKDVRDDPKKADWVSLKMDSIYRDLWRKVNRPYGSLNLQEIVDGAIKFAEDFNGTLVTETMLVRGVNDKIESLNKTASFLKYLNPAASYILVPTRPPAEKEVKVPREETLALAYQIFSSYLNKVELLISNEGTDFTYLDDIEKELLSITSVHPMRKDAVEEFLEKSDNDWSLIENLIESNKLKEVIYLNEKYYMKNLSENYVVT